MVPLLYCLYFLFVSVCVHEQGSTICSVKVQTPPSSPGLYQARWIKSKLGWSTTQWWEPSHKQFPHAFMKLQAVFFIIPMIHLVRVSKVVWLQWLPSLPHMTHVSMVTTGSRSVEHGPLPSNGCSVFFHKGPTVASNMPNLPWQFFPSALRRRSRLPFISLSQYSCPAVCWTCYQNNLCDRTTHTNERIHLRCLQLIMVWDFWFDSQNVENNQPPEVGRGRLGGSTHHNCNNNTLVQANSQKAELNITGWL